MCPTATSGDFNAVSLTPTAAATTTTPIEPTNAPEATQSSFAQETLGQTVVLPDETATKVGASEKPIELGIVSPPAPPFEELLTLAPQEVSSTTMSAQTAASFVEQTSTGSSPVVEVRTTVAPQQQQPETTPSNRLAPNESTEKPLKTFLQKADEFIKRNVANFRRFF